MSIVSTAGADGTGPPPGAALLEVAVLHPRDVAGAEEGGADRLLLLAEPEAGGRSPEPAAVSAVCRESQLPVRVVLRLSEGFSTTGGELARLAGLAQDYLAVGAEGLVLGFLTGDLEVDVEVCRAVLEPVPGVPWTFGRAIDATLDLDRSWARLLGLPGLDSVLTAGSPRGVEAGFDDLVARAAARPEVAALTLVGGGLRPEHVPWLARAGVRKLCLGRAVRPGGSWQRAYVDAGHVRSWRMLLDDVTSRAEDLAR
jgi:copper homeostasis protein